MAPVPAVLRATRSAPGMSVSRAGARTGISLA